MPFDKEAINTKYVKNWPNSITQSEAKAPEEIVLHKLWADISVLSGATGETSSGLTGVTRASVTPEKHITKNQKTKNPPLCLHQERTQLKTRIRKFRAQKNKCLTSDIPSFIPGTK